MRQFGNFPMLNEVPGSTTSPLERGRAVAWRRAGVCHDYQNLKNEISTPTDKTNQQINAFISSSSFA